MKAVGVDLGGHKIAAALVDLSCEPPRICARSVAATPESRTPGDVIQALVKIIAELAQGEEIGQVGVGLPGFINKNRRVIEKLTNFNGFENVEFVSMTENALAANGIRARVSIENDANCFAVGEGVSGLARGLSDYVVFTLGTGIGTGIVAGGRLLLGAHGQAGEGGHITDCVDLPCNCGGYSHAETIAGADGIERAAREKGLAADFKALWENRGDAKVRTVLNPALDSLARCISTISVITDPEMVVLSGGMSRAENLILELRPIVMKYLPATFKPNLQIEISKLGLDAVFYGAASLFADSGR